MFFTKKIYEIEKRESNPVNKMYLHELMLKLKHFEKLENEEFGEDKYKRIAEILNQFITALSNKKYRYNPQSNNGFRKDSHIFSSIYLDDIIHLLLKKEKILKNPGITFDKKTFDFNIRFDPDNLMSIHKDNMLRFEKNVPMLQISQEIEIQYRVSGKRNYFKNKVALPIMIFVSSKNLTRILFNSTIITAKRARQCFAKSKLIIVCETLDHGFYPSLNDTEIDSIFVLRKQFSGVGSKPIDPEILKQLDERIHKLLLDVKPNINQLIKTGIINKRSNHA